MRLLRIVSLIALAIAALPDITTAQGAAAQNPPVNTTLDITLPAGIACAFSVVISGQGKAKAIELPGNRSIFTSPGLNVTVTNLDDPSKQVGSLKITGASHVTTSSDGSVAWVATGRNLMLDPLAGFVLAIGHYSYAFDFAGNLIQPFTGKGQLIDICAMIE